MTLLILGLVLWYVSHLMRRVAPGARAALGEMPGKAILAALSLVAVVMMVKGFQFAPTIDIWSPPGFLRHINNLLMAIAVFLLFLGYVPGLLRTRIRHPMLTAAKTWAFAHLLVNGDLASIVLFGGMMGWAVIDLILINRQVPVWDRPAPGPLRNDLIWAVASLPVLYAIGHLHGWLGYWPFG